MLIQFWDFIKPLDVSLKTVTFRAVSDINLPKKLRSKQAVAPVEIPIVPPTCKATAIGNITTFAKCDTELPEHCRYTLVFKNGRLCKHPHADKIVAQTVKKP